MDLRDWLIIGGVLALVIIIADGIRRVKKRGKLSLDIDNQFKDFPEVDLSSELPNGGARVATSPSPDQQGESEPPAKLDQTANDDVDLLLQGDFKGVGEGAHEWLKDSDDCQSVAPAEDHLVAPLQVDEPRIKEAPVESVVAETNHFSEDELEIPATEQPKQEQRQFVQETDRCEPDFADLDLLQADAEAALAEKTRVSEDSADSWGGDFSGEGIISPVRVKKVEQPVSAPVESTELEVAELETTPVFDESADSFAPQRDHSRPQVALVESEEELDLSKPVTVLMDQMHGRSQSEPEPILVAREEQAASVQVESVLTESEKVKSPESATEAPLSSDNQIDKDADALEAALESLGGVQAEELEQHQIQAEKPVAEKPPAKKKSRMRRLREEIQTSFFDLDPELAPEPEEKLEPKPKKRKSKRLAKKNAAKTETAPVKPAKASNPVVEEPEQSPVLVISVAGRQPFNGGTLFKLVEACGMEYGDMKIFHRYEDGPQAGAVQFSMANAMKPGYFEMEGKEQFNTPAVTFFLEMAQPKDLMNAFDCMLGTAQAVADNLGGVMKDEDRSVMRTQTIEHYRQQIRDFERRRLAKRA